MFNCEGEPSDKHRREVDLYVYTDNVDELYQTLESQHPAGHGDGRERERPSGS